MAHDRRIALSSAGATVLAIVLLGLLGMSAPSGALLVDTEESAGNTLTAAVSEPGELSEPQAFLSGATRGPLVWCRNQGLAGHLFGRHLVPGSYIDAGCILIRTEEDLIAVLSGTWSPPSGEELSGTRREACALLVASVLSSALENGAPLPEDRSGYSVRLLMREALREGDDAAIEEFVPVLRSYLASGESIPIGQCDCRAESGQDAPKTPEAASPFPGGVGVPEGTSDAEGGQDAPEGGGLVEEPLRGGADADPAPAPDPDRIGQEDTVPSGSPSTTVEPGP